MTFDMTTCVLWDIPTFLATGMVEECEDSLSYAFCGDSTTSEAFLEGKKPSKRMDIIRVERVTEI